MSAHMYTCELTDHHPAHGGKTVVEGWFTAKEATWYGEREVIAANELLTDGTKITFRVYPTHTQTIPKPEAQGDP